MIDAIELERLIESGEGPRLEFKPNWKNHREDIRIDICAFANDIPGSGLVGYVVVGLDNDGNHSGYSPTEEHARDAASMRSDGNLHPFPELEVEQVLLRGAPCIVMAVSPSPILPVRLRGVSWIRVSDTRSRVTALEEQRLFERMRSSVAIPILRAIPGASPADLDLESFREYIQLPGVVPEEVRLQNHRSEAHQLRALRFMTIDDRPTALGILNLCPRPTQFLTGAYVQFRRVDGPLISDPTADERRIEGDLRSVLRTLDEVSRANVHTMVKIEPGAPESRQPDYPLGALSEILRNAILHRSYDELHISAPTRFTIYTNRVEITSPGGPYGPVSKEQFGRPDVTSYRNEPLAEVMQRLGYVQRYGVGIALANQLMSENGNPSIEFDITDSMIRAILHKSK